MEIVEDVKRAGLVAAVVAGLCLVAGCDEPIRAFGRPGLGDGEFREPRAISAGPGGVAVVDRSGRLQIFDFDGRFQSKFAVAGDNVRRGLPCGITWLRDGSLALADTHQSYVKILSQAGATLSHFGGIGAEPGQFMMPQRVTELADGRLAVTDHGLSTCNRVQVMTRDGLPQLVFGGPEPAEGELVRPMGIVAREDGSFVVADQRAGLVVFDKAGAYRGGFGAHWPQEGSLIYGLCRAPDGTYFATDIGRDRLLRIDADGALTGEFGRNGSAPGEFLEPWDVAWWSGKLYVADKGNHRVQRIDPARVSWEEAR